MAQFAATAIANKLGTPQGIQPFLEIRSGIDIINEEVERLGVGLREEVIRIGPL